MTSMHAFEIDMHAFEIDIFTACYTNSNETGN